MLENQIQKQIESYIAAEVELEIRRHFETILPKIASKATVQMMNRVMIEKGTNELSIKFRVEV